MYGDMCNETLTPKPRTDTTHALTENVQKNNMTRQQQKQAHKSIRTQLYREREKKKEKSSATSSREQAVLKRKKDVQKKPQEKGRRLQKQKEGLRLRVRL